MQLSLLRYSNPLFNCLIFFFVKVYGDIVLLIHGDFFKVLHLNNGPQLDSKLKQ